jgi:hypothetical protein
VGLDTQATDWQVFGRVSVAGGAGVSAGLYIFNFFSGTAGISGLFGFHGYGFGEGGNLGGLGCTDDVGPITAWSSLECDRPFSIYDMNGAWGRISYLGGAVGVGYSALFITASPAFWTLQTFFHSQYVGGISLLSVGGGGQVLLGGWRFKGVSNAVPNADPAATA